MFVNNNYNYPRTAGGYSLETYEPAVIHPVQRERAEDLVRLAFTEQKPKTTIRRIIPQVPQINYMPKPVINIIQYQNMRPVIYNNPNRIQVVNPNQNGLYLINDVQNVPNITPVPTVKSANSNNKSNPFVYQNLIQANNGYQVRYNNAAIPTNPGSRFIAPSFNNQVRPILRSNSVTNQLPRIIETKIITGQNYNFNVYKRELL